MANKKQEEIWVYRVVACIEKVRGTRIGESGGHPVFSLDMIDFAGLRRVKVEVCFDGSEEASRYFKDEEEAWGWLEKQAQAKGGERGPQWGSSMKEEEG